VLNHAEPCALIAADMVIDADGTTCIDGNEVSRFHGDLSMLLNEMDRLTIAAEEQLALDSPNSGE
jgi:hypothetical protein